MSGIKHTIYFVRHGQCVANVTGETLAPEDDTITKIGIRQSEVLGEHLKDIHFDRIIPSSYSRAVDTAEAIVSKLNKPPPGGIEPDARLKEREMGILIGMSAKNIFPLIAERLALRPFNEIEIPEAETVECFEGRIRSFFKDLFDSLKKSKKPQNVMLISHGLTMRRFLGGVKEGRTYSDLCSCSNWDKLLERPFANTGYIEISVECPPSTDKVHLNFLKINEKNHLEVLKKEMADDKESRNLEGDHDINGEEKRQMMELLMQIPNAMEELSGCIPV